MRKKKKPVFSDIAKQAIVAEGTKEEDNEIGFQADESDESDDDKDSDKKEGASDKEGSDKEDKHSASIANLYKWAAKLKEDFASEAANMTHDVPEKALAIMLNKLLSGAEAELKAFDKKVEQSEEPMENAEEERSKLEAKKDKYQGMIDLLQGE